MNNKVILLVEDNPDDEHLTLRAFRKNKLTNEIIVARDGQEAIDYLFGQGKFAARDMTIMPEVILLDLNLPRIDGMEVLRRIRADKRTALIPVVILTTSNEATDRIKGYGLHANSFIQKPIDFNQFIEVIRQVGLYWLLINIPPSEE